MAFRLLVHKIYAPNKSLDNDYKIDLVIFFLCFAGMIYEVVVSNTLI